MLFAPLPPPVGGITSITAMLHRELGGNPDLLFQQPMPKTTSWKSVARPLINITRLLRGTLRVRPTGRVVFFCSSRASFWEKCVWAAFVLCLRRAVVMVMVSGNFPETFARSPGFARSAAHWLFRRKRLIVAAQSPSWAAKYRNIFPRTVVTHVGATVDPEFFLGRDEVESKDDPLTVLFVGWIIEDKGICDLLDAVESMAPSLLGRARIRLVGPLFGRDAFWQGEIDRRSIATLVELVGAITSRAAILREYQRADAFVFPSHFEGFPVALLEAVAMGLPCVATDVGGVADMLDGGRAGVIVPPCSPKALAAALDTIVSDIGLRRSLGVAAARYARCAFSVSLCVSSYETVLGIR